MLGDGDEGADPLQVVRFHGVEHGDRSRYAGGVRVTDGRPYGEGQYFGRIDADGTFHAGRDADRAVVRLLEQFAADPAKVAAEHGYLCGRCCFCDRALEDERSTAIGYGPICAKHFDMPYPTRAAALERHAALAGAAGS